MTITDCCKTVGKITHAASANGGGVYNDGTLNLWNGSIAGNTVKGNGGGVFNYGTFNMYGGSITGNTAEWCGGGVLNIGTLNLSGNVNITGNKVNGEPNNVYLHSDKMITVAEGVTLTGASVGITSENTWDATVVTGSTDTTVFFSDNETYALTPNDTNDGLKLVDASTLHRHKVCVEENCTDPDHHGNVETWTGISSLSDINKDGYYYLTTSVTLDNTWTCNYDVKLCLNGNTITGADGYDVIRVNEGASLATTDCQKTVGEITHAENATGRGIGNYGTLALWNGSITGNSLDGYYCGGGVFNYGTFALAGGSIAGNTASAGAGVLNAGILTMTGGSIASNTAGYSGGGVLHNEGTFTMSGGSITGNTALRGAGVSHFKPFTMSGGSITANNTKADSSAEAGGIYSHELLKLSGDVTITGNTADGADSNVYLPDGGTIAVTGDGLVGGASVGITAENPDSTPAVVTETADTTHFFSDAEGYELVPYGDNTLKLAKAHKHKVCNDAACQDHGELKWIGISSLDQITGDDNYYLTGDVELKTTWECSYNVNLCLNGKTIYGPSGYAAIEVNGGKTLVITDCHDGEDVGKITHAENAGGSGIRNHGTLTLWNGSITENAVTYEGGGVWSHGTFDMHGGFITGNTAKYGGGVYNEIGSNFTMSGGTISGNTATDHSGGGVCSQGTFNMTGGKIGGNTAKYGGGVYSGATIGNTFTMSDTAIITGNSAERGGGAFIDSDSTFAMTGGSITGNSADSGGGVTNWGAVNLSGDVIIEGNAANDTDSNVYVGCDSENNRIFSVSVTGTMGDNASVGITVENPDSAPVVVTGTADGAHFSSDDTDYELLPEGDSSLKLAKVHKHKVCGEASCTDPDHHGGELTWKAWTSTTSLPNDQGNYYLTDDVELDETWNCSADVKLCLNGKKITGVDGKSVIVGHTHRPASVPEGPCR